MPRKAHVTATQRAETSSRPRMRLLRRIVVAIAGVVVGVIVCIGNGIATAIRDSVQQSAMKDLAPAALRWLQAQPIIIKSLFLILTLLLIVAIAYLYIISLQTLRTERQEAAQESARENTTEPIERSIALMARHITSDITRDIIGSVDQRIERLIPIVLGLLSRPLPQPHLFARGGESEQALYSNELPQDVMVLDSTVTSAGDAIPFVALNDFFLGEEANEPPFDISRLRHPDYWVGREEELRRVVERLRSGESITILDGLTGLGKSSLAHKAIQEVTSENGSVKFADGVAVVVCRSGMSEQQIISRVLGRFAWQGQRFVMPADLTVEAQFDALEDFARSLFRKRDTLIVLDGLDRSLGQQGIEHVIDFFRSTDTQILVTMELHLSSSRLPRDARISLPSLLVEEAIQLFSRIYQKDSFQLNSENEKSIKRIVQSYGNHPYAVASTAARIQSDPRSLDKIAQEIEANLAKGEFEAEVKASFNISIEALPREARTLLTAVAAFSSEEFGYQAITHVGANIGLAAPEQLVTTLIQRQMIQLLPAAAHEQSTKDGGEDDITRLEAHQLVYGQVKDRFDKLPQDEQEQMRSAVAKHFVEYVIGITNRAKSDPSVRRVLANDPQNIAGVIEWAHEKGHTDIVLDLCYGMGPFWRDRWFTNNGQKYLPLAIQIAKARAKKSHRGQFYRVAADLSLTYAALLRRTGKIKEAERVLMEARIFRRRLYTIQAKLFATLSAIGQRTHAITRAQENETFSMQREGWRIEAQATYQLSQLARGSGDLNKAEKYGRMCLALARRLSDRLSEGIVEAQLGKIARARARLDDALRYFNTSLTIIREVQNVPETESSQRHTKIRALQAESVVLGYQGRVARAQGKLEEAEEKFRQSLALAQRQDVQDRRGKGIVYSQLGRIERTRGNLDQAEQYFKMSLDIAREVQDLQSEGVAFGYLGRVARTRGKLDEAFDDFDRSYEIAQQVHDKQNQGVALSYKGRVMLARNRFDKAEEFFNKARSLSKETQDRRGMGIVLNQLGRLSFERDLQQPDTPLQKRFKKSYRLFQSSLRIAREAQDVQTVGVNYLWLARVAEERNELNNAEEHYRQSHAIARRLEDRLDLADASMHLGRFLIEKRGQYEEGCVRLKDAVLIYGALLPPHSPHVQEARRLAQQLGCPPL